MKRARTEHDSLEDGDGGKILVIRYTDCGSDVYSLDSVTPLVFSYLQTANDKHAEDLDEDASPLGEALHYIWRAMGYGYGHDDGDLKKLCPELQESSKKVAFGAWKEYKTTFEEVNANRQCTISNVFTVNCSDI